MKAATRNSWAPEIELKFAVSPEAAGLLLNLPPLKRARDLGERCIDSRYFDTAGGRLQRDGIALRVRRQGDSFVQTAKVFDPAGHTAFRLEREDPVAGPRPCAALLRQAAGSGYADIADGDLVPAFRTMINRRVLMLEDEDRGSRVEVAIDNGFVEASGAREPLSEIELELMEGGIGDLYTLALGMHRQTPLAIEAFTKSQRGYALGGGLPPAWSKVGAFALDPGTSLDDAIALTMGRCYGHWMNNQAAALDGRDIEGVHQMRVALRRLRAALELFAPWLDEGSRTRFAADVKWIAASLAAVRDLDVLHHATLAPLREAFPGDDDLARLEECIGNRRQEASRRLVLALGSPRYTSAVLTLGQWIVERGWSDGDPVLDDPAKAHVSGALNHVHTQVLSHGEGFDSLNAVTRHRLRLRIKRLRYAIQFVGPVFPGADPWLQALSELQDALGAANDAAVAGDLIRGCARPASGKRSLARARGLVAGWWAARREHLEKDARARWRAFTELEPFWGTAPDRP
ncbi:MAG: CYTH and CHAD domain-containing protein [bacterium]|nr:CYTH and CHAD domain-containing protein [bacterium]